MRGSLAALIGIAALAVSGGVSASPYASSIVSATGFSGSGFGDPDNVLGEPTRTFTGFDIARIGDADSVYETSVVYGTFGTDTITTIGSGQSIVIEMGQDVTDDPGNPFGIDLIVYGNGFFVGSESISDASDMSSVTVSGGGFFESNVQVSVSPDGSSWYTYTSGPFGDGMFPTQAYAWDDTANAWDTGDPTDWDRPVDPSLTAGDFAGLTVTEALALYDGAGGGTGFDLSESGFGSVRFVRLDGLAASGPGEVDAVVDVRADVPGDADRDGDVDTDDLTTLADHFLDSGTAWEQADFDGDAVTGVFDLALLSDHWLFGVPASASAPTFEEALADVWGAAVPEPGSAVFAGVFAVWGLARGRRG